MAWFKVDSRLFSHPGIYKIRRSDLAAWFLAGCWAANYPAQRDCDVPLVVAKHVTDKGARRRLVDAGFWVETENGDFWMRDTLNFAGSGLPHLLWDIERTDERKSIPARVRQFIYQRDGFACLECGTSDDLTLDHIWPWSKGGADEIDNLRTLCRSCNSRKGARV